MKFSNSRIFPSYLLPLLVTAQLAGCGGGSGGKNDEQTQPPKPAPANRAPAAVDDSVSMLDRDSHVNIDVLANDSDEDGDSLTISAIEVSDQGVTATIANGKIRYSPPPGYLGTDNFTYTITDGATQASAKVSVEISPGLTISGKLGESQLGGAEVSVTVNNEVYSTLATQGTFQLNVPTPADDSVVLIAAELERPAEKTLILKSYAGWGSQLKNAAIDGAVSENELATLYLSAAGTSAAALVERAAGTEILTSNQLIEASQILPQDLLLESAVALKSVLAGDQWPEFTQADSYALLVAFPDAVAIAESLKTNEPGKYETYRTAILQDAKQSKPLSLQSGQELVFLEGPSSIRRPYGFAIQFQDAASNEFYLAENEFEKATANLGTFSSTAKEISLTLDGMFPILLNAAHSEENCQADNDGYHRSTAAERTLLRYLDTPVFSAYSSIATRKCTTSGETYTLPPRYYQVNNYSHGDFSEFVEKAYSISSYRDLDPNIYLSASRWQSVVSTPNTSGSFTQRFDLKNGYTDTATSEILSNGNLVITSARGDQVEYLPAGYDGAGLRTIALLRRDDGSIASIGGDLIIPVQEASVLATPSKLVYKDSVFSVVSPTSAYHDLSFGFDIRFGGLGSDLERVTNNFSENGNDFSWSDQGNHIEMRYFYDRDTKTYRADCPFGTSNCEEYRFREFELLFEENGEYYVRVHNETDLTALYGVDFNPYVLLYSYVDRFVATQ